MVRIFLWVSGIFGCDVDDGYQVDNEAIYNTCKNRLNLAARVAGGSVQSGWPHEPSQVLAKLSQ
jgi:hypothetical protein